MGTQRAFIIDDESHCEWQEGRFETFEAAMEELRRRALIPWYSAPNRCPCTSWRTCGRNYEIVLIDESWRELQRTRVLEVSAQGVRWSSQSAG